MVEVNGVYIYGKHKDELDEKLTSKVLRPTQAPRLKIRTALLKMTYSSVVQLLALVDKDLNHCQVMFHTSS